MKSLAAVTLSLLLLACTGQPPASEDAGDLPVIPGDVHAALAGGKTIRFTKSRDSLQEPGTERCGMVCRTFRVCDAGKPPSCKNERICYDNPNCDGDKNLP